MAKIGYRCSAEPVENYLAKGGKIEETVGRKCLCNALLANIGHAQVRKDGSVEPALITVGDDLNTITQFLAPGRNSYSAADVVDCLLGNRRRAADRASANGFGLATAAPSTQFSTQRMGRILPQKGPSPFCIENPSREICPQCFPRSGLACYGQ